MFMQIITGAAEDSELPETQENVLPLLLLTLIFGALGVAVYLLFVSKAEVKVDVNDETADTSNKSTVAKNISDNVKVVQQQDSKKKVKESASSHKLLQASLKGHTGPICDVDFSNNGKFLASCSEDRTVRIWNVKDFSERDHKYVRANVEFDHLTAIAFSPDCKAFIGGLCIEQTIRVFKIIKKKDENASNAMTVSHEFDFPKVHESEIICVAISVNGSYIMSADKATTIVIWTVKGVVLNKIETLLIYNSHVCMSPDGNLVAACGFTSDVKMWHVVFKNGEFQQVTRALELKGHTAGVYSFAFTEDSKLAASVSKDGTWKVWNIAVNYQKGQDAYLLVTGSFQAPKDDVPVSIALAHDGFAVAVAVGKNIYFYNAQSTECEETAKEFHQDDIRALHWYADSLGEQLVCMKLVSVSGRSMFVWHNAVGARASLLDLETRLKKEKSDSTRNRILMQINGTKEYLNQFS